MMKWHICSAHHNDLWFPIVHLTHQKEFWVDSTMQQLNHEFDVCSICDSILFDVIIQKVVKNSIEF